MLSIAEDGISLIAKGHSLLPSVNSRLLLCVCFVSFIMARLRGLAKLSHEISPAHDSIRPQMWGETPGLHKRFQRLR